MKLRGQKEENWNSLILKQPEEVLTQTITSILPLPIRISQILPFTAFTKFCDFAKDRA